VPRQAALLAPLPKETLMNTRRSLIILAHAFIGWALCAAAMGIGTAVTTLERTLVIHAVAAPAIYAAVSAVYFTRFRYTSPLATAAIFVGFVMLVDFFGVALLVNRSLAMFGSLLGTWIPFALIFAATYLTGLITTVRVLPGRPV
jgi:hypothetical protein